MRRSRVAELLDEGAALAEKLGAAETRPVLLEAAARLRSGRLRAIVVGEFKRGKSKLINALLDEPELLPTNVDIATNTVTSVRHGDRERILLFAGDAEQPTEIPRSEIAAYVTEQGNPGNARDARHVVIELPNDALKAGGLEITDTPGVGALNRHHTAATYGFLREADAALFVTDVAQPLSRQELDFLTLVREHTDKLVFVVSKKDQDRHYAEAVAAERSKLATHLGVPEQEIRIVAVSSRDKIAFLRDGNPEDLALSGFPELEEELWKRLSARAGDAVIAAGIAEVRSGVAAMRAPLEAEQRALAEHDATRSAELRAEFERYGARLAQLQNEGAEWRRLLTDELRRLERELPAGLDVAFETLRGRVATELEDDEQLAAPQELVDRAALDVARAIADAQEELTARSVRIQERVLAAAQLELATQPGALHVPGTGERAAVPIEARQPRGERFEAARAGFFEFSAFSSTTASLGLLAVGSLALWPLALGAGIGALAGWNRMRRTLDQTRAVERRALQDEIRRALRPVLEDSHKHARQTLIAAIGELGGGLNDELARLIGQERQVQARAKEQVMAAGRASREEAARRSAELVAPLQRLQTLDETAGALDA